MPLLADGINSRLALWHQGSLVGATSFVMLLPETESAVIVLTNTMTPNDAADWISQLLVETVLDSPIRHAYVHLASISTSRALEKFADTREKVEEGRQDKGAKRAFDMYTGSYVGFGGVFCIKIMEGDKGLEILFQGRESQKHLLQHHHDDTFTWFPSWNEQIKRARFISFDHLLYMVHFRFEQYEGIVALNWAFDTAMPDGEDFVKETRSRMDLTDAKSCPGEN